MKINRERPTASFYTHILNKDVCIEILCLYVVLFASNQINSPGVSPCNIGISLVSEYVKGISELPQASVSKQG